MDRAEVVIIGGGAMGTSIAYHLAVAGVTDVLLLESGELGSGSSGKPLGGVRAQFSTAANIRLGARGLAAYGRFAETVGVDIGLRRVGYLFVLRTPEAVADFEAGVALQNDLGVPSRMLDAAQARRLNPFLPAEGILAAAYCAEDGYAHPGSVVAGYAAAAGRLGVRIRTGTPVIGIERGGSATARVQIEDGVISARAVICAAGAWSAGIGEMAGVSLPVHPLRRQIAFTGQLAPRPPRIPFTIDFDSTFYLHNGTGGDLLFGLADPDQPAGFHTEYDEGWLPQLRAAAARCVPELAGVPLERGWAGLYEMTPDANALIGEARAEIESGARFLYCTGFSGHGFLQAPAAGEIVRDLYLGRQPFCDISAFDAARFDQSAIGRAELNIV